MAAAVGIPYASARELPFLGTQNAVTIIVTVGIPKIIALKQLHKKNTSLSVLTLALFGGEVKGHF